MGKKEVAIERREVISLGDLAARFANAKGMDVLGFNWLRAERDDAEGEGSVGNSLAVLKVLRLFNEVNPQPIVVYKVAGSMTAQRSQR